MSSLSVLRNTKNINARENSKFSWNGIRWVVNTKIAGPNSAFGELSTITNTPTVQIDAIYGLKTKTDIAIVSSGTTGAGAIVEENVGKEFKISSGTVANGWAMLSSQRAIRYRAGQGALGRWTARYSTPIANHSQRAGLVNIGTELTFGYTNEVFCILHRTDGHVEIQEFEITTPAAGAETITVTLNGTAFNVGVTTTTAAENATELAAATYAGWHAHQNDGKVVFVAQTTGVKSGTYSTSSTGALVTSETQIDTGKDPVDTHINQTDWSDDKMDGNGPSGMTLDPTKGNVYECEFQYLGYGQISFRIENEYTGEFVTVHRIKYTNNNTNPSLLNPTFRMSWCSISTGSTTNVDMFGASAAGFVQGEIKPLRNIDGHSNFLVGNATEKNILSIRNRAVLGGHLNLSEAIPEFISLSAEGTKSVTFSIYKNATLGAGTNWQYHDENESSIEFDVSSATITNVTGVTEEIGSFTVGRTGQVIWDLSKYNIRLFRDDVLSVSGKTSSGSSDLTAALSWLED